MRARSVGVHDGSFHADEVTACALLALFDRIDRDKIVRSRDLSVLAECEFVCDVGGLYDPVLKRFDHHQLQYEGELSSAGMIWLHLKEQGIVDEATYEFVNQAMVLGVDAHDNGRTIPEVGVCTFSGVISNFVPPQYDAPHAVQTACFLQAFDFALGHLQRLLERFSYIRSVRKMVAEKMQDPGPCLLFDKPVPWLESFFELGGEKHHALFVIMPSGEHWKLRGIPPSLRNRMAVRRPLPVEWAGLLDQELKDACGIPEAVFCHKGRFVSVWETREAALQALKKVLE